MPSGSADPTSLVRTAVLDTSVLLRWAHDHADAEQPAADRLREAWTRGRATFLMLDLSVYELVNVLARRLGRTSAEIQSTVRWLFGLQLPFVRVAERIALDTAQLAAEHGLSGYDAAFVAVARHTGVPLITGDLRLARRAPPGTVFLLGEL